MQSLALYFIWFSIFFLSPYHLEKQIPLFKCAKMLAVCSQLFLSLACAPVNVNAEGFDGRIHAAITAETR